MNTSSQKLPIEMNQLYTFIYLALIGFLIISCENDTIVTPPIIIEEPEPEPEPEPDKEITGESLIYNPSLIDNGYVLVNEVTNGRVYLITKEKGEVIHEWELPSKLGNDAELLSNGKLLVSLKTENPSFNIGGYGGRVQLINPDGSIDWDFEYSNEKYLSHHDVELLPNGNVLMLAWESKSKDQSIQAGYADSENSDILLPESLIEINPLNNQIVWKWHSWDHLIQDFDNTKDNFGIISENPQLINLNYTTKENGDIMHVNGMDYDASNDIIYLSVNSYSEVWVIDHSTTVQEAAINSGGNYDKGGDLIYRFGNPSAYQNNEGEQLFFRNHYPNLLEGNEIRSGNLLIFINGNIDTKQSKILEFVIPQNFSLFADTNNEPEVFWQFTDVDLYSPILGGAVRLPNGNTLITEPGFGLWEVTDDGTIVWKFKNDLLIWRAYSYSKYHSGISALGL